MKKLLVVIFTILLTACSTSSRVATPEFDQVDSSVKEIKYLRSIMGMNYSDIGASYSCSATLVNHNNKNRLITSGHCCGHDLTLYEGKEIRVLKIFNKEDLCELENPNNEKGIELAESTPKITSKVTHIGYHEVGDSSVLNAKDSRIIGRFSWSVPSKEIYANLILTNDEIYHGMSGGPVVASGKLVGINAMTYFYSTQFRSNVAGYVPVETIRAFLDE